MQQSSNRRWKIGGVFASLVVMGMISAAALTAASEWINLSRYGNMLVWFDATTIAQGDILAKVTVDPGSGATLTGAEKFRTWQAVKFPTETIEPILEGRWTEPILGTTEDVSSRATNATIVYTGEQNHAYQHARTFLFDAAAEQYLDTKVKLPAHLADTGTVTLSYFWTEAAGETGKKVLWKFQHKPLAAGETHSVSPTYATWQGPTSNSSLTVKEAQLVTTVSALGWNENDIVYMQIGRAADATDDDAGASHLHHVALEVPIITHRTP